MNELLNVIDRSSNDSGEAGDLIAVTNPAVRDACIDRLSTLTLDDNTFTRCYLRLDDLVRTMDSVTESLVYTHRWRTGMVLATFNMLIATLEVSPTGIPWVTSGQAWPLELVLPDSRAADVPGAIPVSAVDQPDALLGNAYARYDRAIAALDAGDVDAAFVEFSGARCMLLQLYNRYYSTDYTVANPADPKEPPLDGPAYGCP
jgi:hypothetical protein